MAKWDLYGLAGVGHIGNFTVGFLSVSLKHYRGQYLLILSLGLLRFLRKKLPFSCLEVSILGASILEAE